VWQFCSVRETSSDALAQPPAEAQDLAVNLPNDESKPQVAVSDYELLQRIGAGAYGEVWLARSVLGELRAAKIIHRNRFSDARPFEREFEGIRRFEPISRSHLSQLAILHVGKAEAGGCFYYIMELADRADPETRSADASSPGGVAIARPIAAIDAPASGNTSRSEYRPRSLRQELINRGRLPAQECLEIALSLATALAHLHRHGLVHRDIKPSNILFVNGTPKLGDIGLVAEAGDTQSIVGTEGYLPPEGPGTRQADIYSLGKVLHEITTGQDRRKFPDLPPEIKDWADRAQVLQFNEVVLKACAHDSRLRYQSCEELLGDLSRLQSGRSVPAVVGFPCEDPFSNGRRSQFRRC
jgi:serine/threonine protein kinase